MDNISRINGHYEGHKQISRLSDSLNGMALGKIIVKRILKKKKALQVH
jgi:hypothetical protein